MSGATLSDDAFKEFGLVKSSKKIWGIFGIPDPKAKEISVECLASEDYPDCGDEAKPTAENFKTLVLDKLQEKIFDEFEKKPAYVVVEVPKPTADGRLEYKIVLLSWKPTCPIKAQMLHGSTLGAVKLQMEIGKEKTADCLAEWEEAFKEITGQ